MISTKKTFEESSMSASKYARHKGGQSRVGGIKIVATTSTNKTNQVRRTTSSASRRRRPLTSLRTSPFPIGGPSTVSRPSTFPPAATTCLPLSGSNHRPADKNKVRRAFATKNQTNKTYDAHKNKKKVTEPHRAVRIRHGENGRSSGFNDAGQSRPNRRLARSNPAAPTKSGDCCEPVSAQAGRGRGSHAYTTDSLRQAKSRHTRPTRSQFPDGLPSKIQGFSEYL